MNTAADPLLLAGWLAGRSIARGLPPPVADHGGWRVDTASPLETRRYVFAHANEGLAYLARTIQEARVPLKLCADRATMRPILPPRWIFAAPSWLMTGRVLSRGAGLPESSLPPPGYTVDLRTDGAVRFATIVAPDGTIAASGRAALSAGFHVFDQIVTDDAHRRRGLGRAIMARLADHSPARDARPVLVATEAGRALYETIGWTIHSPYTTAVIEGP